MSQAHLNRIEGLLLESLRNSPLELSDRTIPAIAAWLGCTSQVLNTAKKNLLFRGFAIEESQENDDGAVTLHLTPVGEAQLSPASSENGKPQRSFWLRLWQDYLQPRKT